jgi:DNA-binding GntR family transcriptional regulator
VWLRSAFGLRDFEQLEKIQEQFAQAIRTKDLLHWGTLNAALHTALYARARLPQTASIVAGLLQKSDRYTRVQLSTPSALKRALREHGELIDLCKRGQVEPACDLLRAHIEAVRDDLLALLKAISTKAG